MEGVQEKEVLLSVFAMNLGAVGAVGGVVSDVFFSVSPVRVADGSDELDFASKAVIE